jgi:beta-glucosidase
VEAAVHHLLPLSNELSSETALEDPAKVAAAIEAAKAADKVVLCLGQHRDMSGEASSRVHLTLPENQLALLKEVAAVNENIVLVLFAGRPVVLTDVLPYVKSALIVWMPGTEGGNAICDVLFGDKAPEGKLSMSLPRHVGQYPLYYNRLSTGRSREIRGGKFVNGYIDIDLAPLYPFGYGLSYTEFAYSEVSVDKANAKVGETVTASVTLTNVGSMEATETVQLYLHDVVGSVARPVKSLRGVQKVTLAPGESRVVSFEITEDMLKFYNELLEYVCEPGEFEAYIGGSSDTKNKAVFRLV